MHRIARSLAVLVFAVAVVCDAQSATLAGVSLPDTLQVGSTSLVLNGLGLRKKFVVKVYVAGLYLPQKSSDANAIMQSEAPKRIVMHFLHAASKNQVADAFDESFNSNSPDARKTLKAEIARLLDALEPVKEGDQIVFTYVPGQGTTLALNGKEKLTIAAPASPQCSCRCGSGRSRPMRI
jgi:hypothetical protein